MNENNNENLNNVNNDDTNKVKIIGGNDINKSIEEHMQINRSEIARKNKSSKYIYGFIIILILAIGIMIVSRLLVTNNHLFAKPTTTTTNEITISTSSIQTKDVITIKPDERESVSIKTVFDDSKFNKSNKMATLKSLNVSGYSLEPSFSSTNTIYKVYVTGDISDLDIIAVPSDNKSNIEISKGTSYDNYSEVNVKVTNNNGITTIYKIKVYRK